MKALAGRKILVTGGGRGIGRAVSIECARQGADVVVNYLRDDESAKSVSRRIHAFGRRSLIIQANIGIECEVEEMFKEIGRKFGRLDDFVHCASLGVFRPLIELTQIQLSRVMSINCSAFVKSAGLAAKLMPKGGSMVAVSSLGSQRFVTRYGGVGIAKAALEAAVRYLAVELAEQGIRVNAVSGGPVDTEGLRQFPRYSVRRRECERRTPYGRLGLPEDIAKIVVFLCSKQSNWICGQTLIADGGLSLRLLAL